MPPPILCADNPRNDARCKARGEIRVMVPTSPGKGYPLGAMQATSVEQTTTRNRDETRKA